MGKIKKILDYSTISLLILILINITISFLNYGVHTHSYTKHKKFETFGFELQFVLV